MSNPVKPLSNSEKSAFKYLELTVLWEGSVNKTDLQNWLDISKSTAHSLMTSYKKRCPNNLIYNASVKAFIPTEQFIPLFSSGRLDDYIVLNAHKFDSIQQLTSCYIAPKPYQVRPILRAIQQGLRLDICYASIKNPAGEDRIISPHSLINNGQRWHIRAWCEKSQDYRDFVLNRIREIYGENGTATQTARQDELWNTQTSVIIEPDPRLTSAAQQLIALDYNMTANSNGKLQRHYRVRAALVLYWLQNLGIDRYRETPEAQQIILSPESAHLLKPYLPK